MSAYMRNQPNERQEKSGNLTDAMEQKSHEGFEGMNYEQVRVPYNPHYNSGKSRREQNKWKDADNRMRFNP